MWFSVIIIGENPERKLKNSGFTVILQFEACVDDHDPKTEGPGIDYLCHCEERSDVAIRSLPVPVGDRAMLRIAGDAECHGGLCPRNDTVTFGWSIFNRQEKCPRLIGTGDLIQMYRSGSFKSRSRRVTAMALSMSQSTTVPRM